MVIFTRQVPALAKVIRLLFVLNVQFGRDLVAGTTTVFLTAVLSIASVLKRAFVVSDVERPNIGVVNDCVSPIAEPLALVAPSLQK